MPLADQRFQYTCTASAIFYSFGQGSEAELRTKRCYGVWKYYLAERRKGRISMYAIINIEGRLVADPEFRVGKEDREFVTFRLAVNQKLGPQDNSTFFNCTGNEFIAKRMKKAELTKGRPLHVVGNLTAREYTDRNGVEHTSIDVGIMDWHFVGSKPKGDDQQSAESQEPAQSNPTGKVGPEISIPSDEDELPL